MAVERRELEIDGLRLSFLEQGARVEGRPSLVLLHGLMGSADTFAPLLEALPPQQHVVALDFPGAGGSERRLGLDATLPAMAAVTRRVLDDLGLERPVVLGHSHGGAVALWLAQAAPEQVGPLVLLAPAHPFFDEGDPLIRFYLSLPGRMLAYSIPWFPECVQMVGLRRMAGPRSTDTRERLRPYRENLRTPGTIRHLLCLLRTWHEDMAGLRRMLRRRVAHPTLILWGDTDRAVPVHSAAELRAHFELSEMRVLAGVGHRPAEERPDEVARAVCEFADRIRAWGWRYSPKVAESQSRSAALIAASFESGD